ncbi:hypothetical protein OAJ53_00190 [Pelagibacteraceae bacterium]|nr:hypothetical protein [Pelagibacteraceae bacterium]
MIKIIHRVNEIDHLKKIPNKYGLEIDIRSQKNELILHHDPFKEGTLFKKWLKYYDHKFLILNVKEEGLEKKILEFMKNNHIKKFFFLDQSIPFLIKTMKMNEKRCAIRLSEYENILTVLNFKNKIKWVWVDCFTKLPLNFKQYKLLKKDFKLCLVSPELQGEKKKEKVNVFKNKIKLLNMKFDAVCTKYPEIWN